MSHHEIPQSEQDANWYTDWEREQEEKYKKFATNLNALSSILSRLADLPADPVVKRAAAMLYDSAVERIAAIRNDVMPVLS